MTRATILLWLLSDPAPPDLESERQAQELHDEGDRLLRQGRGEAALDSYRASYAAFPDPNVVCSIAAALEHIDRLAEAAQQYEQCLEDGAVDNDVRRRARRHLIRLRTRLARIVVEVSPRAASVSLDGQVAGSLDPPLTLWVEAGAHTVVAEMEGYRRAAEALDLRAGERKQLHLRLLVSDPDSLAPAPDWACQDIHPASNKPYMLDALVAPPPWAVLDPMPVNPRERLTDRLAPPPSWVP